LEECGVNLENAVFRKMARLGRYRSELGESGVV